MPLLYRCLVLLTIITLFSNCSRRDALSKVWFYTYDDTKSNTAASSDDSDPLLTPVHFMNLQRDGRFTAYLQGFDYGDWEVDGDYIILKSADKKRRRIQLQGAGKNEITVDILPDNAFQSAYRFEGNSNKLDEADNPFSLANNKWRIKATHKESDAEITNRLKNHLLYWEKYFAWGISTDKKSLDVRSLPGPLKMYGNGFELVPLEDWAPEWESLFYDKEDTRIAWNKLHYFFTYKRIAWAKTDHKFKMFVSAFQQMQRQVE
ncbi:MAG: hypothetical protein J7621_25360 [Niastella sp.]|nr:hypothetical protein [Niastella sp.]